MRGSIFTFLYLLSFLCTVGQDINILQERLQISKNTLDSINALNELAFYYNNSINEDSLAEVYGKKCVFTAIQSNNKELIARAYYLNGSRLIRSESAEDVERAKNYFAKAFQTAHQNHLLFYEACVYTGLANLYIENRILDGNKALKCGENALKIANKLSNDSLKVISIIAIATGYKLNKEKRYSLQKF